MKMLAVTGATGKKSGGAFVKELSDHKEEIEDLFPDGIRAIMRTSSKTDSLVSLLPNIEISRGDFTDINFLKEALKGVDTLVHIAGIHWSVNIVKAAVDSHVRRVILVHTTGIYSKYKEAGEEYRKIDSTVIRLCKSNKIELTILRPTMIYGNCTDNNVVKFIKMVDKLPIMPVVNGARYELQPVHYKDLGKAYWQVLVNETVTVNQGFTLSGSESIELRAMLVEISKNLGKQIRFFSVAFPIAYAGSNLVYWMSLKKIDYREKVQRLCEPRVYSHEKATQTFGYSPRSFQEGVVEEIKEYMNKKDK